VIVTRALHKTFRPPASLRLLLRLQLRGAPVVALDGVDLTVEPGEIFGLMGPNGAGKSTLLRILAGLVTPSSGTAAVCGLDAAAGGPALARKVGYVAGDERGIVPQLSPREYLAFFAALHGHRRRAALAQADALVSKMGLDTVAERPLGQLSTGMRRRVALGRALIGAPEVLLLDEPTRGVDPAGAQALRAHLTSAAAGGCAVVLATHDIEEARVLCARVAVIAAGRFVAVEEPGRAAARLTGAAHA
jgi:ABC-2 type transport system ATP-binding protein